MTDLKRYMLIILLSVAFAILLSVIATAASPGGNIKGKVINLISREPVPGATIIVLNSASGQNNLSSGSGAKTNLGASSDADGNFSISNVPAGIYNLEFRSVGFQGIIKTDVTVKPGQITVIEAALKEAFVQTAEVSVNSGYFEQPDAEAIGVVSFNKEEIKRSPGAMGDVSRIFMAMPSAARVSDDNNDLAVRGGSPSENGFYVDGIPVPNINHFPNIGSTGGPIGILNTDYIETAGFQTGGFPAQYGDRMSSIVDIKYREGSREQYNFQADLNWIGFGGGAEGPLPGKNGSWLMSFKRSYLDYFSKAAGMGMVIRYGDAQAKVSLDISKMHKLTLIDIFANDNESFGRDDALDQGSSYYGKIDNYQNTAGLAWRALWNKNFFSNTTVSVSTQSFKNDFNKVSNNGKYLVSENLENSLNFRNINYFQINKSDKIESGIDLKYDNNEYDYTRFADTDRLGNTDGDFSVSRIIRPLRAGGFFTYIFKPYSTFTVSAGIRADYYSLAEDIELSPRLSVSCEISDVTKLTAYGGSFSQQLPTYVLAQKEEFKKLSTVKAYHYGLSIEHLFSADTRITLELYGKEYRNMPLDPDDPTLCVMDGGLTGSQFGSYNQLFATGKGYTRGIEMTLQKKLSEDFYGLLCASYFRSRYMDYNGNWNDRLYDNKVIFSVIGGYRPGNNWEISGRWTFAGGCPYTPFDIEKSASANSGVIDGNKINGARYSDYHSMNIRVDKKFYFASQCLDIYIDIWNAYNQKNILEYYWNPDKKKQETLYQWSIMPIFGIKYEF